MALILLAASAFAVRALSTPAPDPCTCASTCPDGTYPNQWQAGVVNASEPIFLTSVPIEVRWPNWLNTSDQQFLIPHPFKLSMDSGSLMIWIPDRDIAADINNKIGAKRVGRRHVIDCDTIPSLPLLTFGFESGVTLERAPEAYIIRVGGSCFSPFHPGEVLSSEGIPTTGLIEPIFERFFDKDIIALQSQVPSTLHDQDFTELIPDKPKLEFEITIHKILFGGETISDQPSRVMVLSNDISTDMHIPHRLARLLNRRIGATDPKPGHLLSEIDCRLIHMFPNLAFTYTRDGKEVSVEMSPVDYLIRIGSVCLSPFVGFDEDPKYWSDWTMGDVFIRRYRV